MRQCKNSSRYGTTLPRLLLWGLLCGGVNTAEAAGAADTREVFDGSAPRWLHAVGKLQVPGNVYRDGQRAHLLEDCSASLVAVDGASRADTIVTAWHCLENYRDLSRPILFTLATGPGQPLQREAYPLEDGGGMHADWAILRLRQPVESAVVAALAIHPGQAEAARDIAMAGFSRDGGKGRHGEQLTYDPRCRIIAESNGIASSNCIAFKGASGGAVVQLSARGAARFSGVISAGDGNGVSTFIPVGVFRSALNRQMR
jgi:hypothetical protein